MSMGLLRGVSGFAKAGTDHLRKQRELLLQKDLMDYQHQQALDIFNKEAEQWKMDYELDVRQQEQVEKQFEAAEKERKRNYTLEIMPTLFDTVGKYGEGALETMPVADLLEGTGINPNDVDWGAVEMERKKKQIEELKLPGQVERENRQAEIEAGLEPSLKLNVAGKVGDPWTLFDEGVISEQQRDVLIRQQEADIAQTRAQASNLNAGAARQSSDQNTEKLYRDQALVQNLAISAREEVSKRFKDYTLIGDDGLYYKSDDEGEPIGKGIDLEKMQDDAEKKAVSKSSAYKRLVDAGWLPEEIVEEEYKYVSPYGKGKMDSPTDPWGGKMIPAPRKGEIAPPVTQQEILNNEIYVPGEKLPPGVKRRGAKK